MSSEVEVLERQCTELDALLGELRPEDWSRPTRCPPLSVAELLIHVTGAVRGYAAIASFPTTAPRVKSRVTWWVYERPAEPDPGWVDTMQKAASGMSPSKLVENWRDASAGLLDALRAGPLDRVCGFEDRTITAADMAAVGVLEVGVHTMDLSHATGNGERITPEAAAVVVETLEALAGGRLPASVGWDGATFVLVGTGRRPLTDGERESLGPMADRFPLLA